MSNLDAFYIRCIVRSGEGWWQWFFDVQWERMMRRVQAGGIQ